MSAVEPPEGADGVVHVSVEGAGIGGAKAERRFLRTDPLSAVYALVRCAQRAAEHRSAARHARVIGLQRIRAGH